MNHKAQRAALTRAINSGNPAKLIKACRKARDEWEANYWPDDWADWQRALDDMRTGANLSAAEFGDEA